MNGTGRDIGDGGGNENGAWVQRILNRVFRCSHRRQTRPMTPKGEDQAYAVCLDCGARIAYDLSAIRAEASALGSRLARQTSEAGKEKVLDIPAQDSIPTAPERWQMLSRDLSHFHREFGTTAVLGLLAIGLAGGLFYLLNHWAEPKNVTAPKHARPLPPAESVKSASSLPAEQPDTEVVPAPPTTEPLASPSASTEPTSTSGKTTIGRESRESTSVSESARYNKVLRLEGKGSVIVLGRNAATALELSQHPTRLGRLTRRGSLFTVPRGTAIKLLQENGSVAKVLIMRGSKAGQAGWVETWQAQPLPSAEPVKSSPSLPAEESGTDVVPAPQTTKPIAIPTVPTEPGSTTRKKTMRRDSSSVWGAPRSNQVSRLEGNGPVIVLGRNAVAALELSQHPDRLSRLTRRGSLFTVPRGTAIKLLQGNGLVIKVRILEGSMAGQEGWVRARQVWP
jgi:hypothetical protein